MEKMSTTLSASSEQVILLLAEQMQAEGGIQANIDAMPGFELKRVTGTEEPELLTAVHAVFEVGDSKFYLAEIANT